MEVDRKEAMERFWNRVSVRVEIMETRIETSCFQRLLTLHVHNREQKRRGTHPNDVKYEDFRNHEACRKLDQIAKHKESGRLVMIRACFPVDFDGVPSYIMRQASILKVLEHENIVELIETFFSTVKVYLVFEYLGNDLGQAIRWDDDFRRDGQKRKLLMYQLLSALHYCHTKGIMHRNLKPNHLLLDQEKVRLKVGGFSNARELYEENHPYSPEVGTLWYRAPEILLGCQHYTTTVDLWSTGCIFAEMASGRPLFTGLSDIEMLFQVFQTLGTPCKESWPDALHLPHFKLEFPKWKKKELGDVVPQLSAEGLDLLRSMLACDPKHRIHAEQALGHAYFHDVHEIAAKYNVALRWIEPS